MSSSASNYMTTPPAPPAPPAPVAKANAAELAVELPAVEQGAKSASGPEEELAPVGRHAKSAAALKREATRKAGRAKRKPAADASSEEEVVRGRHTQEGIAEREAKKPKTAKRVAVSDEVAVRFDHVTKTYHLYKNDRSRIVDMLFGNYKHAQKAKNANDDLSFEIHRGEAVALIGRNGAGKSTCLKMITGVIEPTSGTVEVNGRVSALLELGAGFNPALTGRENLEMRSHILGISKEENEELMPKVLEFSELGEYLDQPLRSYSSGMKSRLGFALAVSTHPEILIVDEALSVGDRTFSKKCIARIKEIMEDENVTVLFVTHSSSMAKKFCSRGIVLNQGKLEFDGDIKEAIKYYEERN